MERNAMQSLINWKNKKNIKSVPLYAVFCLNKDNIERSVL